MSCIYSDFFTGKCELFDENFEMSGCDENGFCICEDDEDPSYSCENYEEC